MAPPGHPGRRVGGPSTGWSAPSCLVIIATLYTGPVMVNNGINSVKPYTQSDCCGYPTNPNQILRYTAHCLLGEFRLIVSETWNQSLAYSTTRQ